MKRISLTRGKFATVCNRDYKYLSKWSWYCTQRGYAVRTRRKSEVPGPRAIHMHRVVAERMGFDTADLGVDHIDGAPANNRRGNLRPATQGQNTCNKKVCTNNTSGYKGVCWSKKNRRWVAEVWHNGVKHCCGSFTTSTEAAAAYDRDAQRLHGQFARLNKVVARVTDRRGTWVSNTSGFRGVTWDKFRGKWVAQVHSRRRKLFGKRYDTKEEAALAYNKAAKKYFGPNAYQNLIKDIK